MEWQRETALHLIREIGIGRLVETDGCWCTSFAVKGVEVDFSCRKGGGGHIGSQIQEGFYGTVIRVTSGSLDVPDDELVKIGNEVVRQFSEFSCEEPMLRLCTYDDDKDGRCKYCHGPRAERWGYYCAEHDPHPTKG